MFKQYLEKVPYQQYLNEKSYLIEKIPYLISSVVIFILLPIICNLFDNKHAVLINLILFIFPLFIIITSCMYSYKKEKFSYLFALLLSAPFLISCIIFLNSTALIYILFYIFLSLCGQGSAYSIKKLKPLFKK